MGFGGAAVFLACDRFMTVPVLYHPASSPPHISPKAPSNRAAGDNARLGELIAKDEVEVASFLTCARANVERGEGFDNAVGSFVHSAQ